MQAIRLPKGRGLPAAEFRRRHRALVIALWGAAFGIPIFTALEGYSAAHSALHGLPPIAFALMASRRALPHRLLAGACALGLMTAAALLVHSAHGVTEAHFAFFVLIICLTLYEDWIPFLVAIAFVLLHHGVTGMLDPEAVFNGASRSGSPWTWALIHAAFVTAAGSAAVLVWGFNEKLREEKNDLLARLDALTKEDQLTGVASRRAWDERLAEEMKRAARTEAALSVVMLDLDELKSVNDTQGHEAGDRLLQTAANGWMNALRESDFIARLGGDEFGVLLPGCCAAGASDVVDRLVEAMPDGHTFSAGVARWDGIEAAKELLKRADAALYHTKGQRQVPARPGPESTRATATRPQSNTVSLAG